MIFRTIASVSTVTMLSRASGARAYSKPVIIFIEDIVVGERQHQSLTVNTYRLQRIFEKRCHTVWCEPTSTLSWALSLSTTWLS